jgi:hypothetical protein
MGACVGDACWSTTTWEQKASHGALGASSANSCSLEVTTWFPDGLLCRATGKTSKRDSAAYALHALVAPWVLSGVR